jgi:hypothetical protein
MHCEPSAFPQPFTGAAKLNAGLFAGTAAHWPERFHRQAIRLKSSLRRTLGICMALLVVGTMAICLATPLASNATMLLMDRSNFIPAESSIFSFEPYVINDGSSNYWLYGQDRTYYYHFTYLADVPYLYIPRKNTCAGFDRADVRTWCSASRGIPRG